MAAGSIRSDSRSTDVALRVTREQVLAYRWTAQQLDRPSGTALTDAAVLNIGVQDTGGDGGGWALTNRGVTGVTATDDSGELALLWTLRGAPHFYRRTDVAAVAAGTAPFSPADAAKRMFDAARPLKAAGIDPIEALDIIAAQLREIVVEPTVKGYASSELTARLAPPYLRHCRPCNATHAFEQPFRLAALRAGLELDPGTSPPLLRRIPRWRGPAKRIPKRLQVVRAYLRLLGPASPQVVAAYIDAPVADVVKHWPADATAVDVEGRRAHVLRDDVAALQSAAIDPSMVRLLSPFDLFLQARDRDLLVPNAQSRRQLWPVLGRPGVISAGGKVVGTWRPRANGRILKLDVQRWEPVPDAELTAQAERLAAYRGLSFVGFTQGG